MSLALHAHHIVLLATLAFVVAVLIPHWYTTPDQRQKRNVFDICNLSPYYICRWTLLPISNHVSLPTILPLIAASAAVACAGCSVISLLLGSWYIQRFSGDIGSKWLLVLTIVGVLLSFLLSCLVWTIMLTTNLHQLDTIRNGIRLEEFGFSLWISIGASGGYFYALFIYLIAICKNC